jgi:hypothetical protein
MFWKKVSKISILYFFQLVTFYSKILFSFRSAKSPTNLYEVDTIR